MISFEIPGPPQGKARARTFFNNKSGRMASITPEKTVLYENLIKLCYQKNTNYISDKPLRVYIKACFEPAKSTSKSKRIEMLTDKIRPTKKPDIDNIAKVVLDALNGIAYKDDTQVVTLEVRKFYKPFACVNVDIEEVGD
ncbi:RusA family crossover junction endodeoxyribonuclease [Anaerocolumna chitinilytica]|uniref:Phage protein n=1 Tax=Anaerocolumna chitinilytica TaxID=1727145 RepID=A0A7M3SAL3_9FIRM|nr:RusA family crossover junction endodeoxyribonuclease [Anaerocolumna chitinilytica]BCK01631.1 phage protein [Anaerocolumna chitinilytica]